MKTLLLALALLASCLHAQAKEYKIYACLLEDTPVELADGQKWLMDKGDVFPVLMYKDSQKKMVLQLAATTFMVESARARILKDEEVAAGLENYRKTVETYEKGKAAKAEDKAQAKPAPAPAAPKP